MNANVIAFPTPLERDELEFTRCGSSSYTRALDSADALLADVWAGHISDVSRYSRCRELQRQMTRLESYRDDLPMVALPGGGMIELALVPAYVSRDLND